MPEATRIASPISYVEAVTAPLLVQQGANDTRCPRRQMEAYADKMEEHGKSLRLEWLNAGHSSDDKQVTQEHQQMRMEFALETLSVIRQASVPAAAAARL